jgi:hypothetical protein
MPKDDPRVPRLADVAAVLTGLAPPRVRGRGTSRYAQIKDLDPGRRALVRGGAPSAARARPIQAGDVLLAARGQHNLAIRPDPGLIGAYPTLDLYLLRPKSCVDPDYLAAFLSRQEIGHILRASTTGSSLPRIHKTALSDLRIPLPALARQRAIGALSACARRHIEVADRLRVAEAQLLDVQLKYAFEAWSDPN